jgi:hypothetical protein
MATEAEIRARAMQEFQMAVEVAQIRRQAILEARTEALTAVPAGHAALEVYREAERAADAAFTLDHEAAQRACHVAEIDAHTKHGEANVAVMATLQDDNARAEDECRAAMDQCEQEYQAAWLEAQAMVGPTADKARKAAKAAREKARAACEKARAKALATADTRYQKALFKNNETMIAETAAAQEAMVAAQQAARDKREKAVRAAGAALAKALNADADARAVEADFQARLLKDAQDAEAEKAAVWERMRADLAAAASPGLEPS